MAKKPAGGYKGKEVHVKKTKECPRCGSTMEWSKVINRMAFFCLKCGCIEK